MNENLKLYIEKLKIKNLKLNEFFNYVSTKNFKISEDEIEHIKSYLQKRENILQEILEIEEYCKSLNLKENDKNNENILKIVENNDILIKKILDYDDKNKIKISKISNLLKTNIKSIKNTEKANQNYYSSVKIFSEGNYFDTKS